MASSYEYVGNLHVHTPFSDGAEYHTHVAKQARRAGLDFLVFTDHNVRVKGIEGYFGTYDTGYVLVLSGQEVHDRWRNPQCNHTLIYNVTSDVGRYTSDLQTLISHVDDQGGMAFIAHPDDRALDWLGEPAIPWLDRHVSGFTGLEIWNYMSRCKDLMPSRIAGIRTAFRPEEVMIGPNPRTMALWDQLLEMGQYAVGIGNADAHGTRVTVGPLTHTVFPYDFLFNCVNTHIITHQPLTGTLNKDRALLYDSLRVGRAFVGYDLLGETRGFRFSAQSQSGSATMGEQLWVEHGVTLQVLAPRRARIKLIRYGSVVAEENRIDTLSYVVSEPGAYRVEVWLPYRDRERAWIISNPIYLEAKQFRLPR